MNFIADVSADKLRGGFYTPPPLVHECCARLAEHLGNTRPLCLLEPSAGDGAFIRGIDVAMTHGLIRKPTLTCVELAESEAAKCTASLRAAKLTGEVVNASFFAWAKEQQPHFDAVVGNPPFVRYQFVPQNQRGDAELLFARRGAHLAGVANLWIPFVLLSLDLLRDQGAFAFVLPGELVATKSAGVVRSELIRHFARLRIDRYPRGSFAGILQDVIVVSGQRSPHAASIRTVTFVDHGTEERAWSHRISDSKESWTRYLLNEKELAAFTAATGLPEMHRLGELASLEVSIVTGANDFFTVDQQTLGRHMLRPWARPLLARTADSPGIVYQPLDQTQARLRGRKSWLLDFAADAPDPLLSAAARTYLLLGDEQKLHTRYKCRIRRPWYRVPDIRSGALMMSKRAHQFHRLILNKAGVFTTDTIYRGWMRAGFEPRREALVAAFHNSLTILSSEIEGRTYGGGVLELVPSEIARLVAPLAPMDVHLEALDRICRGAGGQLDADDTLIQATNELLCEKIPALKGLLHDLDSARLGLRRRRFHGS